MRMIQKAMPTGTITMLTKPLWDLPFFTTGRAAKTVTAHSVYNGFVRLVAMACSDPDSTRPGNRLILSRWNRK
jgi:hypothetical protein